MPARPRICRAARSGLEGGRDGESIGSLMASKGTGPRALAEGGLEVVSRWVHRISSSATGLIWLDALHTPKALNGARIVFGDIASTADHFYLPVAREGSIMLAELNFEPGDGPGLFGNKDSLLADWRAKLLPAEPAAEP